VLELASVPLLEPSIDEKSSSSAKDIRENRLPFSRSLFKHTIDDTPSLAVINFSSRAHDGEFATGAVTHGPCGKSPIILPLLAPSPGLIT